MRTLALRLEPIDGESLPSYLHRYACAFGIPPADTLRETGLLTDTQPLKAAGPYPLRLSEEQTARFCTATALGPERLERMLLSRYEGIAFAPLASDCSVERLRAGFAHTVAMWTPRACPDCLRENSAWQLHWLLRWSVVCVRHQRLLFSLCPGCRRPLRLDGRKGWSCDDRGPERGATTCWQRHQGRICRYPLHEADSPLVDGDRPLLEAQRRIEEVLDGRRTPMLAGKECEPLQYLRDLSVLVRITQEYQTFPRVGAREPGEQIVSGQPLLDPARVAPTLVEALAMADAPDPEALSESIRAALDRRYAATGWLVPHPKWMRVDSPVLRDAIVHARAQASYATVSARFGFNPRCYRRPADLHPDIEPRHVPQLYRREDYEGDLDEWFRRSRFSPSMGRRFCSVLLVRMLTPASWDKASRYLDIPAGFKQTGLQGSIAQLNRHGSLSKIIEAIKRTTNNRAASGELVDYEKRRAHLATWQGIDAGTWRYLQPSPHPDPEHIDYPKRRAHASVWLWCELTSGHKRRAPVTLPHALRDHHRFKERHLDGLRDRLLILGQLLLDTPTTARSTIETQLAVALTRQGKIEVRHQLSTIEPTIGERVLAHVSTHTGVDIHTLSKPSPGSHTPPAVTHARLLTAALLRQTALASSPATASIIGGHPNRLSTCDRDYRVALKQTPTLAAELEQLKRAVESWETPSPIALTQPHNERMREIATSIKTHADELFAAPCAARLRHRTSMLVCRAHTDLTWAAIATLHDIATAQPASWRANVNYHCRTNPDFAHRYQRLLEHAQELRRAAGFANAHLTRGLTRTRTTRRGSVAGSNKLSNVQLS